MEYRLRTGFNQLSKPKLITQILAIKDGVNSAKAREKLPEPWASSCPTLAELTETITRTVKAFDEARDGSRIARAYAQQCRQELTVMLLACALYFESVALRTGDLVVLECTGYGVRRVPKRQTVEIGGLPATSITVRRGNRTGEVVLSAKRLAQAGGYEAQVCQGDPNVETNWKTVLVTTTCRRVIVSGLIPGKVYYFRLRGISSAGYGAWSDVANLMVV